MLKSLVASCLCALSVNSSPLPSRSIDNVNALVGDTYRFEFSILDFTQDLETSLFLEEDSGIDSIRLTSFNVDYYNYRFSFENIDTFSIPFDFCRVVFAIGYNADSYYQLFGFDTPDDYALFCEAYLSNDIPLSLTYSFTFEVLSPITFSSNVISYLTKVEPPYTPPSKSNLYRLLYDFYYSIFSDDDLAAISTGYNMPFDNWLAHTCTIITLLVLVFVCFLFLKWLFKVISGLILLKH